MSKHARPSVSFLFVLPNLHENQHRYFCTCSKMAAVSGWRLMKRLLYIISHVILNLNCLL